MEPETPTEEIDEIAAEAEKMLVRFEVMGFK
jgi:hypothetical protein